MSPDPKQWDRDQWYRRLHRAFSGQDDAWVPLHLDPEMNPEWSAGTILDLSGPVEKEVISAVLEDLIREIGHESSCGRLYLFLAAYTDEALLPALRSVVEDRALPGYRRRQAGEALARYMEEPHLNYWRTLFTRGLIDRDIWLPALFAFSLRDPNAAMHLFVDYYPGGRVDGPFDFAVREALDGLTVQERGEWHARARTKGGFVARFMGSLVPAGSLPKPSPGFVGVLGLGFGS